jgi:transcriptional regulator with PAS, ATPase and Fis domain
MIAQKTFRKDLFYRLNVIKIELPPLRRRKEDIPLLVKHFIEIYSRENGKEVEGVSEDFYELLDAYAWPGNVRELENLIERAIVFSRSKVITRESLPPFLLATETAPEGWLASTEESLDLRERTQSFQKKIILTALKKTKGVQKQAARLLGVKPTTLNEMIKRLEIDTENLTV